MLSLRRQPSFSNQQSQKHQSKFIHFAKLLLPPFIIHLFTVFFNFIKHGINKFKALGSSYSLQPGEISKQFNRRTFEEHLQSIKLSQEQLGFTNQVLYQQNKKTINYYLPVFVTNKIKNIQDVSVQTLSGNISCTMIINVCYEGLPQEIIKKLQNSIIIQLNRGEAVKLQEDGISITVKRQKKSNFLIFTLRKLFLASLISDTLWSPFQLVELIISITLNTVTIAPNQLDKIDGSSYKPDKQYKISFNCMRNSDDIPISYALDCVFGIYDLAQKKLETYFSKLATYGEIRRNYEEYVSRQTNKIKFDKECQKNKNLAKTSPAEEGSQKNIQAKEKPSSRLVQTQKNVSSAKSTLEPSVIEILAQNTMRRLSIRPGGNSDTKKAPAKVKYFQYSHFVIPLYKYPGNSLATIFIPIFLLALVSLAIFFQQPQLSGRIGAIATMILGYIALIPSIKEQLPPSSKITVIETVVYIETMCCLLCLYESFQVDGEDDYKFIWYQSYTFLLCLVTHISTFIFIIGIYAIHKVYWQPSYNSDVKVIEIKPGESRQSWDNPYCDEVFIKFNKSIKIGKYTDKQREELLIKPLKPKIQAQSNKSIDSEIKAQKGTYLLKVLAFSDTKKIELESSPALKQNIQEEDNEFLVPDPDLYYKSLSKLKPKEI